MDPILRNAEAKREAAKAKAQGYLDKAKRHQDEARRWDDFIRMYNEAASGAAYDMLDSDEKARPSVVVSSGRAAGVMAETESAVSVVLREHGRPINTSQLLRILQERGYRVGGIDPISTLSARLSRSPGLHNIRGEGWWLKELADDNEIFKAASSANIERQIDHLTEPGAKGREAGPGGGT